MTIERAIEILTPDLTRYTPTEYEEALGVARWALTGVQEMFPRLKGAELPMRPEEMFPDSKVYYLPKIDLPKEGE